MRNEIIIMDSTKESSGGQGRRITRVVVYNGGATWGRTWAIAPPAKTKFFYYPYMYYTQPTTRRPIYHLLSSLRGDKRIQPATKSISPLTYRLRPRTHDDLSVGVGHRHPAGGRCGLPAWPRGGDRWPLAGGQLAAPIRPLLRRTPGNIGAL